MTNTPFQQQELDKIREEFKYYLNCGEKELTQCEEDTAYIGSIKNVCITRSGKPANDEYYLDLFAYIYVNQGIPSVIPQYTHVTILYPKLHSYTFPRGHKDLMFVKHLMSLEQLIASVIYEVKRRENEYLHKSVAKLQERVTMMMADNTARLIENASLNRIVNHMLTNNNTLQKTVDTLQEQVKILVTNVGALKQENADLKQAISDLSDRQITLDQENVILRQEVDMLKKHTNIYPSYDYDAIRLRMDVHRVELMHTQRIISKIARRNLTHPLPIALVVKHD